MLRRVAFALALFAASTSGFAGPTQGGAIPVPLPLFPMNNWWNTDITSAPVDSNSANFISFIGTSVPLHPDWGGDNGNGTLYGFPYIIVDASQPKKTVTFDTPDESDGVGMPFYPIPDEAITQYGWIEGGRAGNVPPDGDRHILIVEKTNNTLYELYHVFYNGTNWTAGSGAFFDMKTNNRRPEGWTSADAAGLAMLPGLVRYDEVYGPNEIGHAFRVTERDTNGHVYPASHDAGSNASAPPMGARLRLKSTTNISGFSADVQKIFRAFMKYGLIVADNGSDMYISGSYDNRWNMDALNNAFGMLHASDFEVVQRGWQPTVSFILTLPQVMGSGDLASATLTAYDSSYNVATGYRGTVHFTCTDGAATLPIDYTFTAGDAGAHAFPNGFILRTPGGQTVTVKDVATPTITNSRNVIVGPPTPTGLDAHATTTTSVSLSWNVSSGANQYEIMRASAGTPYASLAMTSSLTFTDSPVAAGATYVYKVRAIDSSSRFSPLSIPDAATTILFSDDPVATAVTAIKALHITEMRQAVNAIRAAAGIGAMTFTDSSLSGVVVKAVHFQELRDGLTQARSSLALPALTFTDPTLTQGVTVVKAAHMQELRGGVE